MWDLPAPGIELVSPALVGRFLTNGPSGKSSVFYFLLPRSMRLLTLVFGGRGKKHTHTHKSWPWIIWKQRCCCSVAKSCLTPYDPVDCTACQGSSVHWISQARILEWVAIPSSGDLPDSGMEPVSPAWQADSLPLSHQGSPVEIVLNP